jgi:hypothetical protein
MSISRYPRPGHRIAPLLLREVLRSPLPDRRVSQSLQLCDLDESTWGRFSPETCKRLGAAVISSIPACLPDFIQQRHLPILPDHVTSEEVLLEARTRKCLTKRGVLDPPQKLAELTIGEVCGIPSFGNKSLVDLLTTLESLGTQATKKSTDVIGPGAEQIKQLHRKIQRAARKLQRSKNVSLILRDDPRFGHFIREIASDAKNAREAADILVSQNIAPIYARLVLCRLVELIKEVRAARRMPLEAELWDFTRELGTERDRRIIISRLGWDGRPPRKLESVGQRYGITRERVRQICTRVEEVQKSESFLPMLDRVLKIAAIPAPIPADEREKELVRRGLTTHTFDAETLLAVGKAFGRKPRFTIETLHGYRVVLPSTRKHLLERVYETATAAVRRWGVANVEDLAASTNRTSTVLRQLLPFVPAFKWLDESSGWFWITDGPRNSLLTPIRKILAISPVIDIGELRAGVGRPHRRKGFAPPRRVLLEVCRQLPWCRVDGNRVTATQPQNPDEVLSDSEKIIFKVLKNYGPVLQRSELERLCLVAGINRHSFWISLSYCPILTRYASSVYGLRGAEIPAGVVERLIPKRSRKWKVLVDYGWTVNRNVAILYRISAGMLSNGIVSVPAALKSFLQGRFALVTHDKAAVGTLVVKDNCAWGLGPFFSRRGGEPGDYLSILFDLSRRVAVIEIGDAGLTDNLQASRESAQDNEGESGMHSVKPRAKETQSVA